MRSIEQAIAVGAAGLDRVQDAQRGLARIRRQRRKLFIRSRPRRPRGATPAAIIGRGAVAALVRSGAAAAIAPGAIRLTVALVDRPRAIDRAGLPLRSIGARIRAGAIPA